jgi:hypothetical protein
MLIIGRCVVYSFLDPQRKGNPLEKQGFSLLAISASRATRRAARQRAEAQLAARRDGG